MRLFQPRRCLGGVVHSLVLLAVVLGAMHGSALGSCDSESPAGVLACYAQAYSVLDISLLESVLAQDYTWIGVARPHAWTVDRDAKLETVRRLFSDPNLVSAVLTFGTEYHVVEGAESDTWRIEDIPVEFVYSSATADGVIEGREVPSHTTIYVRRVGEPSSGYVIYREVAFYPGAGDDR